MIFAEKKRLLLTISIITAVFLVTIFYNKNSAYVNIDEQPIKTQHKNSDEADIRRNEKTTSEDEIIANTEMGDILDAKESLSTEVEAYSETVGKQEAETGNDKDRTEGNGLSIEHAPVKAGSFVIINSTGYEKFTFDTDSANVYVDSVNYYAENLSDDIKIYCMIVPTSSEFNIPSEYRYLSGSQKEGIEYSYSNMHEKVIKVDAYSNFEANKNDYLYFKTDHHWTALGAYRAYEAFMNAKGEKSVTIESYKRIDAESKYLGSIYSMTANKRLENNPDNIWYYKPLLSVDYTCVNRDKTKWSAKQIIFPSYFNGERKYAVFMGGDAAYSHISVNSQKYNKILIVKDSFGNAFIPFLLPHYKDIYVVDPRYFTDDIFKLIYDNKIDEVLIINYASVLQLPAFSRMIKNITTCVVTSCTSIKSNQ